MKKFRITWEYIREGTSEIEAKDLDDAIDRAEEEVTQWDTGWKWKTVEEVTEDES